MDDPFDPLQKLEIALVRAEHQKRFQMSINFVKEKVGPGTEYRNSVVRVVVSEGGAYYELLDMPEEFSGATGENIERRFIKMQEAVGLLTKIVDAIGRVEPDNTRQFTLMILYKRSGLVDRKNCYIFDYRPGDVGSGYKALEVGAFQPGVMPLFFKVRLNAEFAQEIIDCTSGIVFCMSNAGDRNLLVRIPFDKEPLTELTDLPPNATVN